MCVRHRILCFLFVEYLKILCVSNIYDFILQIYSKINNICVDGLLIE